MAGYPSGRSTQHVRPGAGHGNQQERATCKDAQPESVNIDNISESDHARIMMAAQALAAIINEYHDGREGDGEDGDGCDLFGLSRLPQGRVRRGDGVSDADPAKHIEPPKLGPRLVDD